MVRFSRSLNTKLLLIVLLFVGLGSVIAALRQSAVEAERLEVLYDYRLKRLSGRYQARITEDLQQRQLLVESARTTLLQHLVDTREKPLPEQYALDPGTDGAYRRYDQLTGVFIHPNTELTPELLRLSYHSGEVWEHLTPLVATSFDAFYMISPKRLSRIWPQDIVRAHRPDHDVTAEIFFTYADPDNNPKRETKWTPIYYDTYTDTWMISVLVPLYDGDEFIGVVGGDLDMTFLFDRLAELVTDGDGVQSFIFDEDGNLILHSQQSKLLLLEPSEAYSLLNMREQVNADIAEFIDNVLVGEVEPGEVYTRDLFGVAHHVNVYSLRNMNWHIALHYPEALITKHQGVAMAAIYKNIVIMALIFAVVLYCSLRFFVTNRITRLAQATANVNISRWQEYVPDRGSDEISQMGRSVNAMLDKINDLFQGLNENILNMERLAYYDQLTGLQNRVQFKKQLRAALHASDRDKQHLALLYLDLDHFKRINDTLGHEAGDKLLIEVANRLRQCLREDDSVARLGGDEFAILLRRVDNAQFAFVVADKVIAALNTPMQLLGQEVVVGVSIGITLAPDDSRNIDTLMKNADLAMYQAKDKGRNALQFYTSDMNFEVENRLNTERELRRALRDHEFELYYQPQIDFRTGEIVAVEALIRWHHPERGLVSPVAFIPVAEDSGLIVPIGRWALYKACQQARNLQKALGRPIRISVNVSARQLRDDCFIHDVEQALVESRLDPKWLELEITESALMAEGDKAIQRLERLREQSISLAIDDFGTGYSSLSHLKRLPVTRLKVDRSFVQDLPDNEDDRAITSLIVAMANSLYHEVVAEGIETQEQLEFLARCGCDYAQGFYFSKPLPADELLILLFNWQPDPVLRQIFT